MGSARDIGNTSVKQNILKLEQEPSQKPRKPIMSLAKGQTEELPFKFTIPVHVDGACSHPVSDEELRKEHLVLPPCLSVLGPDTVKIQYHIVFVAQVRPLHTVNTAKTVARQPIIVVPTRLSWPSRLSSGPRIKETELKSWFGTYTLGKMQIMSRHATLITRDIRQTGSLSSETVAVGLTLNFTSKSEADPPRLLSVKRRLTTQTFLSTVPWQNLPTRYPGLALSKQRGIRQEITRLSELKLPSINWQTMTAEDLERANSQDETIHSCHLNIPIAPTADIDTVPTFYSCLIAREYTAKFTLRFHSEKVRYSSVSLEVPVEILYVNDQEKGCAF